MRSAAELIEQIIEEQDMEVRAFYDSGMLCFATLDDVAIESENNYLVNIMCSVTNEVIWPHNHPIHQLFDNYEGSIEELYFNFKQVVNLDDAMEPCFE